MVKSIGRSKEMAVILKIKLQNSEYCYSFSDTILSSSDCCFKSQWLFFLLAVATKNQSISH